MNNLPFDIKSFKHLDFKDMRGNLKCLYEDDENLEIEGFSSKISNSLPFVVKIASTVTTALFKYPIVFYYTYKYYQF